MLLFYIEVYGGWHLFPYKRGGNMLEMKVPWMHQSEYIQYDGLDSKIHNLTLSF